jgi:hypothetical protein
MLFRFLLIFLISYLIIRFISNLFKVSVPKNNPYQSTNTHDRRKEGDVSINVNKKNSDKKISKDEGEYIDFEES